VSQPEAQSSVELSCHHCAMVQPAVNRHCDFCRAAVHHRKVDSLQRTWLFLLTGLLFYIPANLLPIMVTSTLGAAQPNTIVGGVLLLWEHGSYPIAIVIFIASVAVPMGKFLVLLGLASGARFRLFAGPQAKVVAYRATEFIGRWSMVDVFVVAFLAALIQLGNVMAIQPGPAVLAFAAMVVSTMLAAASFEPKMFWDDIEQQ
jgi:paraquat-inducible protein A